MKFFSFFLSLCLMPLTLFPHSVKLKISPVQYELKINQQIYSPRLIDKNLHIIELPSGNYQFHISAEGYYPKTVSLQLTKSILLEEKLEKKSQIFSLLQELKTGKQPKCVEFTPDGQYIASALLSGKGVDIFGVYPFQKFKEIDFPSKYAKRQGFVEIAYVKKLKEMWVSQMTTGLIHRISLHDFTYLGSINTLGIWSKVIHISYNEKRAYVSNWESHDISVIDIDQFKTIRKIKTSGIPRGMATSADDKYLYACIYDNGEIQKINTQTLQIEKTLRFSTGGAKRHIVHDPLRNIFFVSDMHRGSILAINGKDDSLIKEVKVDRNINTIKLTHDGKFLFLSSRGPNNPESYLKKGPEYGKIYILDTSRMTVIDWIWGRNQPTGLALAPASQYLAFSDFLDNSIELYKINVNQLNLKQPF